MEETSRKPFGLGRVALVTCMLLFAALIPTRAVAGSDAFWFFCDLARTGLFAVAAYLFQRRLTVPGDVRLRSGVILLVLLAAVLLLDYLFGSPWAASRFLACAAGALLGISFRPRHLLIQRAGLGVALILFLPYLGRWMDGLRVAAAYPVLADFERTAELWRWSAEDCALNRVSVHTTDGKKALAIEITGASGFQGLTCHRVARDWRDTSSFAFTFYNPSSKPLPIILWLESQADTRSGTTAYQVEILLQPGAGEVTLGRDLFRLTPRGESLDFRRMTAFGFRFTLLPEGTLLYLDAIRIIPTGDDYEEGAGR